jgi:MFS family permease
VTRSARTVLATATAAQSAISLVNFGLPAIGPELAEEFELGLAMLGVVLTAGLLGSGLTLVASGVAVDRYGARTVTLAGTALGTASLAGAAFASGPALLIPLLFLFGVGTSAVPIAGIGAIFRAFPASRRAWALGVRQMAVPLGGITAAVALPPLAHAGGTRTALLFCAGMLGLLGGVFGIASGDARLPGPERPRAEVRRILGLPGMGRLLLVAGLLILVLQAVLVFAVPAAEAAGLSRFAAGAVFFAIQITAGVARVVWGRLADAGGGSRRVRTLVEAGWTAAAGGVLFALSLHVGPGAVLPAVILFAFGALGWNALVYVRAGEMAPPRLAAQAVSVAATLVFLVSAALTPPMGALAEHAGWDAFWLVAAGLAAAAALVAATIRPTDAERLATESGPGPAL